MVNKKAQQLSTTAIILIVLGVMLLVLLIVGFVVGWDKIMPWLKPSNNVAEIVQNCQIACSTGVKYDYCSKPMQLNAESDVQLKDVTCYYLSEKQITYGVAKCGSIECDVKLDCASVGDKIYKLIDNELKEHTCTADDIQPTAEG